MYGGGHGGADFCNTPGCKGNYYGGNAEKEAETEAARRVGENSMRMSVLPTRRQPKTPSAWRVLATAVLKDPTTPKERRERLEAARALARLVLEDDGG
jgi:hypothetical protein